MSEKLKSAFPHIIPVTRPEVFLGAIFDFHWLAGFIDGKGCFMINVKRNQAKSSKGQCDKVWWTFQITQHSRDTFFMQSIIKYLNCGRVQNRKSEKAVDFLVYRLLDINKVITFLEKYPLQSVKQKDYKDFCIAAKLIENKPHLTIKGIEKIKMIQKGMNTLRLK